jgi:hypothetical protein
VWYQKTFVFCIVLLQNSAVLFYFAASAKLQFFFFFYSKFFASSEKKVIQVRETKTSELEAVRKQLGGCWYRVRLAY